MEPFILFGVLAALLALLGGLTGILVWALAMQRQSLVRQKDGLAQVEESLELSRRTVENVERLLHLTEQSVKNQEEMIRLLRLTAGGDNRPAESAAAFQASAPEPGPTPPR